MITPAISVLSAVEGLKIAAPSLADLIVPITAAIIVVLFLVQRLGTGAVGRLFGPVMGVWFVTIGAFGPLLEKAPETGLFRFQGWREESPSQAFLQAFERLPDERAQASARRADGTYRGRASKASGR